MKPSKFRMSAPQIPWVIWGIFLVCVLIELMLVGSEFGIWGDAVWRTTSYQNGGFYVGLLSDWRPNYDWQPIAMFLTYGFLHAGPMHLAVNMITLFGLGMPVFARVGQIRFLGLYLISMVGGGIGFGVLSGAFQPMVGASGALFGLAGAIIAWEFSDRIVAKEKLWPVFRMVGFLVVLNAVLWWAMKGQLAWETHLGGFVFGWITALTIDRRPRSVSDNPRR